MLVLINREYSSTMYDAGSHIYYSDDEDELLFRLRHVHMHK